MRSVCVGAGRGRSAFFTSEVREMLSNYLPVLIFLIVASALAVVLLVLGTGLGRYFARFHDDRAKLLPYECGFDAFEDTRTKFDVRYYLVAILFIVFEIGRASCRERVSD